MCKFTLFFTAIIISPILASAQDAFFPSYSAEIPLNGDLPVYNSTPIINPQYDSVINAPLTQPPLVQPTVPQPSVMTSPSYSVQIQPAYQNVDSNPRLKPVYVPQVATSIVVSPAGGYPGDFYQGYWQPGHYRQLTGSPYFYSAPNAGPRGPLAGNSSNVVYGSYDNSYSYNSTSNYPHNSNSHNYGQASSYGQATSSGANAGGDPYNYHFGPGFYRSGEYGHYRFPYYSYRRPWYHPGFAGYNRDTNLPW